MKIILAILGLALVAGFFVRPAGAQFRPCVWPNLCRTQPAPEAVAQFRPCVWPNLCKTQPAPIILIAPVTEVAQFTTCVYPRTCAKSA